MSRSRGRVTGWFAGLALLSVLASGCDSGGDGPTATADPSGSESAGSESSGSGSSSSEAPPSLALPTLTPDDRDVEDPELRDELLYLQAQDQLERTGEGLPEGAPLPAIQDYSRTERLKEIIAESGWPTRTQVGPTAATSAWLIAQHSDHDVPFQETALELLRTAFEADEASGGDLAYLTDRVAANTGRPQTYGTQIGCVDGQPELAFPLVDPDNVETLRVEAGLGTLAAYFEELRPICAEEEPPPGG